MSVEKVFWEDPYLSELTARVTSSDGPVITVDRTIAYAFSGGQESDAGTIQGYPIVRAEKREQEIFYTLAECPGLVPGDEVSIRIDWPRRYRLMRLHFAAEIVLELVYQHYNHPEKIGAHIAENRARLDFAWQGSIAETFTLLNAELQRIIEGDYLVRSEFEDREHELRYWQIEQFAKVPCGGTHLRRTGEIGSVQLKRNNIGKGKERIEITLREP